MDDHSQLLTDLVVKATQIADENGQVIYETRTWYVTLDQLCDLASDLAAKLVTAETERDVHKRVSKLALDTCLAVIQEKQ